MGGCIGRGGCIGGGGGVCKKTVWGVSNDLFPWELVTFLGQ